MSAMPHGTIDPLESRIDDYTLMTGIRARDAGALGRLYDRYSSVVYAMCLRALRDPGDAEDLLIDIFAEVWERGERYDPLRGSPAGHLMGLARSRIVDRLRSRNALSRAGKNETRDVDGAADVRVKGFGPLEAAINAEQCNRVSQALQELPTDQRQALELAYFEALSHSEVASRLGQPLGTVKSRIRQALIQLRDVLSQHD